MAVRWGHRVREESDVGVRLKGILDARGLTQQWLACESGVSPATISLLIRGGIAYPRVKTATKLCRALGLPVSALLPPEVRLGESLMGSSRRPEGDDGDRVVLVPVVRVDMGDTPIDTGEVVVLPAALVGDRPHVRAVTVRGGGIDHAVSVNDMVVCDPDVPLEDGSAVVIVFERTAIAAVHLHGERAEGSEDAPPPSLFRTSGGDWYADREVMVLGVVLFQIEVRAMPAPAILAAQAGSRRPRPTRLPDARSPDTQSPDGDAPIPAL